MANGFWVWCSTVHQGLCWGILQPAPQCGETVVKPASSNFDAPLALQSRHLFKMINDIPGISTKFVMWLMKNLTWFLWEAGLRVVLGPGNVSPKIRDVQVMKEHNMHHLKVELYSSKRTNGRNTGLQETRPFKKLIASYHCLSLDSRIWGAEAAQRRKEGMRYCLSFSQEFKELFTLTT